MEKERIERLALKEEAKILLDFLIESTPEKELPVTDAIFIFGHYDPRPALQAAKLWKMGKAPKIIICGKGREKIPVDFESEADFYASVIEQEGIPNYALVLEKESTNTLENIIFGMRACSVNGINPESLILCAMPPLLRRSCATFRKQFPAISVCGSAFLMSPEEFLTPSRLLRVIGEFDRLKIYSEKGDVVPVVIPEKVLLALEKIKEVI
ncbi:MAG: hypothetical protein A3I32_02740 [Candidatus Yanofskybacteria bacterium RIFCSPLOWO2_02_FULL_45_10]|uniref:DUF218 domain-containing protein n=2 Tax=Candidatus Yanofskyibacteriota TaxID=1752733 RepID=A0A1F8G1R8_9BACT|nr:MAG: hypothetical protein A3F25_00600 [Candidatus Yanofskybacteria bacterium RIFCSPHIGHO2_12_FULL_45_19b]OGN31572.1 MAG: hypothetical protein A3I32_02740 [Candidatus Yanofskybacteria bacterium RIFCSPLOWO2_02_FULL_45_10]